MAVGCELMRDDVPRLAGGLTHGEINVAARECAERDDFHLRARLEHDHRSIEERECGVRVRERPQAVTLTDDLTRLRERVRATGAAVFDIALEDRELTARGEAGRCGREQDAQASREEQEDRGDRRHEEHRTTPWLLGLCARRGEGDDLRGRRAECAHDRGVDIADRCGDDVRADPREHVLHLAARLLIEWICHRERGLAATSWRATVGSIGSVSRREEPRDRTPLGADASACGASFING